MLIKIKKIKISNAPDKFRDRELDFEAKETQELLGMMSRLGFWPKVTILDLEIEE